MSEDRQAGAGDGQRKRVPDADAGTLRELGERALGPDERGDEQLIDLDKRIEAVAEKSAKTVRD